MYKKLGILGGMGPLATYTFYKNIIESSPVQEDQKHINMVILNAAHIPDRTAAILHGGESPLPELLDGLRTLENCGCDLIAVPCNTSHYYFDEMQDSCRVKILNMIELTAERLEQLGAAKIYLMATAGTIKTGVYQKYLGKRNIEIIVPSDDEIDEMMRVIYGVKAGRSPDLFRLEEMARGHKSLCVLGCTELSTLTFGGIEFVDAMAVLKDKILELFGVR